MRPQDGNGDSNARCDIGAFEVVATMVTAVRSFAATVDDKTVTLQWETAAEDSLTGFWLYRSSYTNEFSARRVGEMIPSTGSTTTGANYAVTDQPGTGSFTYTLVLISTQGTETKLREVSTQLAGFTLYFPMMSGE